MSDRHSRWERDPLNVHAKDCAIAITLLGAVYVVLGETAMLLFVYSFALSVVLFLLLSIGLSDRYFGDDDDYFD